MINVAGKEMWLDRKSYRRWVTVAVLLALIVLLVPTSSVSAASIVVNSLADNTANDGVCTLREAITAANTNTASGAAAGECVAGSAAPTVDTITFSASGTINVGSNLPEINGSSGHDLGAVTIDGGGNITLQRTGGTTGLTVGRGAETTSNVIIQNLTISAFTGRGIDLIRVDTVTIDNVIITNASGASQGIRIQDDRTTNVTIEDSRIGVDAAGDPTGSGGNGIQINDGADNVTIRNNTISANSNDGIQVAGGGGDGSGHLIENNRIGTDPTGATCGSGGNVYGNETIGIQYQGGVFDSTIQNNIIGCNGRTQTPGGSNGDGITISANSSTNNQILNNYIGTNASGATLGNAQNGIQLTNGVDLTLIRGNTIANNGTASTTANNDGVRIDGSGTDRNTVSQNSIYNNGGVSATGLGIDLNGNGVQPNDVGDPDSGSNDLMNFPVIISGSASGTMVTLTFSWDFKPGEGPWVVEFFCNSDGGSEGRTYEGSTTVPASPASGTTTLSFSVVLGTCNTPANKFTATATNDRGSTSEFSAPLPLGITLADFRAEQVGNYVLLTWETNSELNNRGFNLYRGTSDAAPDRQLNETLIPSQSQGNPGGFIYTWEDRADLVPSTTYFYWVEDVDIYGAATMHGPVSVDYTVPTAVTLSSMEATAVASSAMPLAGTLLALLAPLAGALAVRRRRA